MRFYLLRDPVDGRVRWVGRTRRALAARLADHVADRGDASPRSIWIATLHAEGRAPTVELLEERETSCVEEDREIEQGWIALLLAKGEPLLNIDTRSARRRERTAGGDKFSAFLGGANPTGARITIDTARRALGVSDPTILAWRDGEAKPSPILRDAIERWTSGAVKAADWVDDEERKAIERAASVEPVVAPVEAAS